MLDTAKAVHDAPTNGASGWKASRPQGDILAPDGKVMEKAGAVRDGGSFYERMGKVACWNAVMDEDRYMVRSGTSSSRRERVRVAVMAAIAASACRRRGRCAVPRRHGAARDARRRAARALSAGGAARADPRCVFLVLPIAHDRRRQLLRLRLRPDHPGLRASPTTPTLFGSPVTWRTYLNTLKFAAIVWALTLRRSASRSPISSPSTSARATMQMVLFLVCTVPFLTSNIIRMISWIPFLGRNGLAQLDADRARPRSTQPLEFLLFSDFAVVLAMVHLYTLFMVMPIFNTLMRIDRALIEAARDAGASGWQIAVRTSSSRSPSPASPSARSSSSRW